MEQSCVEQQQSLSSVFRMHQVPADAVPVFSVPSFWDRKAMSSNQIFTRSPLTFPPHSKLSPVHLEKRH
jgi:hypothetical protein